MSDPIDALRGLLNAVDCFGMPFDHPARVAARAALAATPAQQAEFVAFEDRNGALRDTPEKCQAFGAGGIPAAVWVFGIRFVPERAAAPAPEQAQAQAEPTEGVEHGKRVVICPACFGYHTGKRCRPSIKESGNG